MKIPFEQQKLQQDAAGLLETALRVRGHLNGHDVRTALEQMLQAPLPEVVREHIERLIDPSSVRPGRPARDPSLLAREEFAMKELDARYHKLRATFEVDGPCPDRQPPSERAYRRLADEMRDAFGPIDWLALRNKHSAWRSGRLHASEQRIDSDDFDAEIERQFPPHNKGT
jgi:hypothetical protein